MKLPILPGTLECVEMAHIQRHSGFAECRPLRDVCEPTGESLLPLQHLFGPSTPNTVRSEKAGVES